MAQTTTAGAGVAGKVEIGTNGSTWADISGSVVAVEPANSPVQSGESPTLDGDTMIVTSGKREPTDIEVRLLWTKTTGEAFEVARAIYETPGRVCYLRWSPEGGATGAQQFTTTKSVMTNFLYPKSAADDAAPIPGAFTVRAPAITTSVVAAPPE